MRKNSFEHDCSSTGRKKKVRNQHALAFITSLPNEPIEKHVDFYFSIEKFRAAYSACIPALPGKANWPKSDHGFFMHPPLLKAVAGRPKTERHKCGSANKGNKRSHQCPICKEYGDHWPTCKKGSKEDIEAIKALRYMSMLHLTYMYTCMLQLRNQLKFTFIC